MSQQPPNLCDRDALQRNRQRRRSEADFLYDLAAAEIKDRLSMVKRGFTDPVIVTGAPHFADRLVENAPVVADFPVLDLQPAQHDLIIHFMGLHWADDPVGQLIQCNRALKRDGLLLAVCFAGQTLNELRSVLAEAEAQLTGGLSPRIAPMGDIRDMGALMQRARFALPVADLVPFTVEYDTLRDLVKDLRGMGESNALALRQRRMPPRRLFEDAEALYRRHFPGDTKALRATFELLCLAGWAPAENQPKPLRPGTAQTRLADALGTRETKLPD